MTDGHKYSNAHLLAYPIEGRKEILFVLHDSASTGCCKKKIVKHPSHMRGWRF